MPNTVSAKKSLRQSQVRRDRNRAARTALRTLLRKTREAIAAKDVAASKANFAALVKKLDRAAGKNLIHLNSAARTKSRLTKSIKALESK
jgi:small subunit ribosomal protein S20